MAPPFRPSTPLLGGRTPAGHFLSFHFLKPLFVTPLYNNVAMSRDRMRCVRDVVLYVSRRRETKADRMER
jgi:hypothetical protein